jgi:hypothetical protein
VRSSRRPTRWLVAFWPRGKGSGPLTALGHRSDPADKAGQTVDKALTERLATVLGCSAALGLPAINGRRAIARAGGGADRARGLWGKATDAYVTELVRRASLMPVESLAQAAEVVAQMPNPNPQMQRTLLDQLWGRVRTLSRDGRLVYAGLVETGGNAMILPSETRSIAEVTQAVALTSPNEPRLRCCARVDRARRRRRLGQHQRKRGGVAGAGRGVDAAGWIGAGRGHLGDQPQTATLDHDQPVRRWTPTAAVPVRLETAASSR